MSNQLRSTAIRRHGVSWLALLVLAASLGGCVAYPGYGYGPGYEGYGGYPVVGYPAPVVGYGYWGGGGGGQHGGGEHGGGGGGGHGH